MAIRRKNTRFAKKKRYVRRSRRISRRPRGVSNNVHHFKERFVLGVYQAPFTNADFHNGLQFSLGQCTNSSNLAGIYDQYRINKIAISFRPISTETTYQAGFVYPGKLLVVKDTDDASALTSQESYYQHTDCKVMALASNRYLNMSFTPSVLTEIYRSGVSTTYSPKFKQWVDMAHLDTPHYGIKFGLIRNGATGAQINWPTLPPAVEAFVTMYYSCKNVR